jgi:hypothetical protein
MEQHSTKQSASYHSTRKWIFGSTAAATAKGSKSKGSSGSNSRESRAKGAAAVRAKQRQQQKKRVTAATEFKMGNMQRSLLSVFNNNMSTCVFVIYACDCNN